MNEDRLEDRLVAALERARPSIQYSSGGTTLRVRPILEALVAAAILGLVGVVWQQQELITELRIEVAFILKKEGLNIPGVPHG
jgi:hypothetical protein